jgi:hypothetical protein
MKILVDPIHTNDPHFCVMNYKMQAMMRHILERRDDIFFYYLIPSKGFDGSEWDVDYTKLLDHPNVKYLELPTCGDRMKEYLQLSPELREYLSIQGPCWDFDILVTARVPMVPIMRQWMNKISSLTKKARRVITVDDMPMLSFKLCVGQIHEDVQDRQTLSGYLAADGNYFISFWEKDASVALAKQHFSPAKVRELANKSYDCSPILVHDLGIKKKKDIETLYRGDRPFTVGYTQRWEKVHRKTEDIVEIMRKHWVYRGQKTKMRFVVTSNSKQFGNFNFLEVYRAPREEFWRMMREEVDVILILTIDDDYSMSLIEPLTLGTPAIVKAAKYVKPTLGDDYPFIVTTDTEAYAMVKAFYDDYAGMYQKFVQWQRTTFTRLMNDRNLLYWPDMVLREIQETMGIHSEFGKNQKDNPITEALVQDLPVDISIPTELQRAHKDGRIGKDLVKVADDRKDRVRITFNYDEWYRYKLDLVTRHGYVDASTTPGHLKKVEA